VTNGIGADIGAFRFDLSFDAAGDYYYVVKEVVPAGVDSSNPTKNGITFDTTEYKVKVTVADNGTGALTAVADIVDDADDVAAFTNSYSVTGTYSTITGVKNLDGAILSGNYNAQTSFADLFEFELYSASVDGSVWTEGALLGTTNPDDAGSFSFTVGEFTRPGNHY
jgi:pilin isopeptide linkage protein